MKDHSKWSGLAKVIKQQLFAASSHARTGVKNIRQQEAEKESRQKKNKGTRCFIKHAIKQ